MKEAGTTGVVFAVVAHPDDIEFYMAGTMLLLGQAGCELHYMTVASGSCGSLEWDGRKTRRIRREESEEAARFLGARYHPSLADDLEVFYEIKLLRRLAAVVREVRPTILLTHSPEDYMEDHMNTCRLAVTAAFARGMPNFRTVPARLAIPGEVTLYHAMPHGLEDGLRRPVERDGFVDTTEVIDRKRQALALHRSQKEWLDASQGMDSYLKVMDELSLAMGRMSGRFAHAEAWRRHSHLGFCGAEADPLAEILGERYASQKRRRARI